MGLEITDLAFKWIVCNVTCLLILRYVDGAKESSDAPYHSVIYKSSDVVHPSSPRSTCKSNELQKRLESEADTEAEAKQRWTAGNNARIKAAAGVDNDDNVEESFTKSNEDSVIANTLSNRRSKRQVKRTKFLSGHAYLTQTFRAL